MRNGLRGFADIVRLYFMRRLTLRGTSKRPFICNDSPNTIQAAQWHLRTIQESTTIARPKTAVGLASPWNQRRRIRLRTRTGIRRFTTQYFHNIVHRIPRRKGKRHSRYVTLTEVTNLTRESADAKEMKRERKTLFKSDESEDQVRMHLLSKVFRSMNSG